MNMHNIEWTGTGEEKKKVLSVDSCLYKNRKSIVLSALPLLSLNNQVHCNNWCFVCKGRLCPFSWAYIMPTTNTHTHTYYPSMVCRTTPSRCYSIWYLDKIICYSILRVLVKSEFRAVSVHEVHHVMHFSKQRIGNSLWLSWYCKISHTRFFFFFFTSHCVTAYSKLLWFSTIVAHLLSAWLKCIRLPLLRFS